MNKLNLNIKMLHQKLSVEWSALKKRLTKDKWTNSTTLYYKYKTLVLKK